MIKPVLSEPGPVLRKTAKEVPLGEISSPRIKKLLKDMSSTLHSTDIGIGLAAPQIGESLRVFLVSLPADAKKKKAKIMVFINPKIIKTSKKKELLPEGCLSVTELYGKIERFEKVSIEAYDGRGRKFRLGASGLFAQVIQHETDHLNGVLFIDKAKELYKIKNE